MLTSGVQPMQGYDFMDGSQSSLFVTEFWQGGLPVSFLRHHSPKAFQTLPKARLRILEGTFPIVTDVEMEQVTGYLGVLLDIH